MAPLKVAVVSCDPTIRLQAARAFDSAPASWAVRLFESPPNNADIIVFGPDADPGDGIVFDPEEPERTLEEVATATGTAPVLVATAAQRGVGVTSVALHMAAASARVHRTCLVDCNESWGVANRLGLGETPILAGRDPSVESLELAAVPVAGGFRVLVAARAQDALEDLLRRAARVFGALVVDAPDGASRAAALTVAATAVMVISPTRTSATRARELLESHQATRWAVVSNRLGPGGETTKSELESLLGRRIALELPCAPALRDVEDESALLSTRSSRWGRRVGDLYTALDRA